MPRIRKKYHPPLAKGVYNRAAVGARTRTPADSLINSLGLKWKTFGNWLDLSSEVAYDVRSAYRVGNPDGHPHYPPDLQEHPQHARGRFHFSARHGIPDA